MEEELKVTVEEPSSVNRKLTVEIPAATVERSFLATIKDYRRKLALPGFRRGKVPVSVIESRYLDDVAGDVVQNLVPESYGEALRAKELNPVSEPKVEVGQAVRGEPLSFTAEFEIMPSVEVSDYRGLKIDGEDMDVTDQEVDDLIGEMRQSHASLKKIEEERGLRADDVAMIDFEGTVEGKALEGGKGKDFPLTIGSDTFIPGFEDNLLGARAGEEREFFVKLPDDFNVPDAAGREASFRVKVTEIREKILPELDDEFARDMGDYESLAQLRERLRTNLRTAKEAGAKGKLRGKVVDALIESAAFEVPASMVQNRREIMLAEAERYLLMRGVPAEEIEKSRGKLYEDTAAGAERKVRATLILGAIARLESIEVSEEELQAEIERIAVQNKMEPGEARRRMVQNDTLEHLKEVLREEKTLDFLVEHAETT